MSSFVTYNLLRWGNQARLKWLFARASSVRCNGLLVAPSLKMKTKYLALGCLSFLIAPTSYGYISDDIKHCPQLREREEVINFLNQVNPYQQEVTNLYNEYYNYDANPNMPGQQVDSSLTARLEIVSRNIEQYNARMSSKKERLKLIEYQIERDYSPACGTDEMGRKKTYQNGCKMVMEFGTYIHKGKCDMSSSNITPGENTSAIPQTFIPTPPPIKPACFYNSTYINGSCICNRGY